MAIAIGYRLLFLKKLAMLRSFVLSELCGEEGATQMSLPAPDVTNKIRTLRQV
jgi:hypothetical protein